MYKLKSWIIILGSIWSNPLLSLLRDNIVETIIIKGFFLWELLILEKVGYVYEISCS